mgnify:CR=1 FL=1
MNMSEIRARKKTVKNDDVLTQKSIKLRERERERDVIFLT